jgi:hypothetical protein
MFRYRTFRPRLETLEDRCVPATFTVKNLLDGPSATPPAGSLRAAIKAANDNSPGLDTIVFKPGLEGVIKLDTSMGANPMQITGNLVLAGPGSSKITVDGNAASGIFVAFDNNPVTFRNVTIRGLTLFNGSAAIGGAILNHENLTVVKSVITGNTATTHGGGLYNVGGALTIRASTVSGNTATMTGGGLLAGYFTGSQLTIVNSTITNNYAGLYGGGFFSAATSTTVKNSQITLNTAQDTGLSSSTVPPSAATDR